MNNTTGAGAAQNNGELFDGSRILGVWHRPNSSGRETNLEELCQVLDEFKEAGINLVFLETFYHGMAAYKTELVEYHNKLFDFEYGEYNDYLSAFVSEADKRGINVFAWVQDFYIGFRDYIRLVVEHPDWLLVNQSGSIRHMTEGQGFGGYIFLDPANPEVKEYLLTLYDDILTRFPKIKGLNLDYIRYPISIYEEGTDTGYTKTCMKEFAKKQGIRLSSRNPRKNLVPRIESEGLLEAWTAHKADYITGFVSQVRDMVNEKHQGKLISTAIFSELDQAYKMKKQSIRVWLDRGYVDFVTPMIYFYDAAQVYDALKKLKDLCGSLPCYTGLYTTYHKQTVAELDEHIKASEAAGADGIVLFDAAKTFFEAQEDYATYLSEKFGRD
ncbi:MAG: family 10 glycosylhydrolase [Clostridia bacterium]|nr:family 10 glycosylhydrolase [Clostridia bacterium]